ncbi:MAG: EF-hand domain-containing protein [Brevundimonas sp.]|nr:MAG: EF-hand domain-containing protein [Brevundimonas sp.]
MRLRPILLAAPAVMFLSASAAFAQTPPPPGAPPEAPQAGRQGGMAMGQLPRTADAIPAWSERIFGRLDANADGAVTGNELTILTQEPVASMGGGRLRAMISRSDANRDARVSGEEFAAGATRAFERMDANGDGQLSDDELPQAPAPQRPMAIPMPAPANPMPMPMPDGSGG